MPMANHKGLRRMKRVVILGRGACGKSTLARCWGELTGLPVIELDKVFWRAGFVAMVEPCSRRHYIGARDLSTFKPRDRVRGHRDFATVAACPIVAKLCGIPRGFWSDSSSQPGFSSPDSP
jgi:hypothetical protein